MSECYRDGRSGCFLGVHNCLSKFFFLVCPCDKTSLAEAEVIV